MNFSDQDKLIGKAVYVALAMSLSHAILTKWSCGTIVAGKDKGNLLTRIILCIRTSKCDVTSKLQLRQDLVVKAWCECYVM